MELREVIQTVQQRNQGLAAFRASLPERREHEIDIYDELFGRLDAWLKPLVAEGKLTTARKAVTVMDGGVGEMVVNALSVRLSPCVGIEILVAPTGVSSVKIRNEIKLRRADRAAREDEFYIFRIIAEGEEAPWLIARRTQNAGRPKVLTVKSFEEAICAQCLA